MKRLSPAAVVIAAGGLVIALSFGARSIFGIVLDPISAEYGWPREVFSISIALQNLVWGLAQPVFGRIADRFGDRRALMIGLVLYLAGMLLSAFGTTPLAQHLGAGVLVGFGVAGTGFGIVLSLVGRATPEAGRSRAMGTAAAIGSGGQMLMPLLAGSLTEAFGWQTAMLAITGLLLPMLLCIPLLKPAAQPEDADDPEIPLGRLLRGAFAQSSYLLLTMGFFVCGFHVGFLAAHLPPYVAEVCGSVTLGAATLSIIGAANVAGTYLFGRLGAVVPKPFVLSGIYAMRAVVILGFLAVTPTPLTVIVFSLAMGLFWLPTVPLTSALVATIFGARNMGMLYGFVFLSHQVGSFLGVWMGGRIYDATGNYDWMWWISIALAVFSALVHLPVREARVRIAAA
ncbi:MFS transporter [Paralimibaculum aggregatum]|uniref:MFS transporter n=1 Tax=Paralimibaculum aggregatum TaxID=3036245 RepID=A0ABQ6LP07_9RHOB|nr:MFS transporter [Limibaculum sp. NKW23]GMG82523.1 MFS transporter [Limibaculum sp. NKW23]